MEKMKRCKVCKKEIAKSSKICPSCGKKQGRSKIGIIIGIVALVAGISMAIDDGVEGATHGGSSSPEIAMVQDGHLSEFKTKTVGQAVDGFFGNAEWESGIADDGENKGKVIVNAVGNILFSEKEVEAAIQFIVDVDAKTFEFYAFELNGIPQNQIMIQGLLEKMYE